MRALRFILLTAAACAAASFFLTGCGREAPSPAQSSPDGFAAVSLPAATLSPSLKPSAVESALPDGWEDGGIFSSAYAQAYRKLKSMSLEEKVGQMLLARCPDENIAETIKSYYPGGFVLFERDFAGKTNQEVIDGIQSCQDAARIPMIMAVDEEGGRIVRVSSNPNLAPERFLSPRQLYNAGGIALAREDAAGKAALLKALGLNLNLAPVADVSQNPFDYIYARTPGLDADQTAQYVEAVVGGAGSGGISSALKHFPGYGNNVNTHTGIAVDNRPFSVFEQSDFLPFTAGIAAGAECVMVSHNIVQCMDADVPASLSPAVHQILREQLGFTGLTLTDDLSMEGVRAFTGGADPSVRAALAGNDMLITSDIEESFTVLISAAESGELPVNIVDRAAFRILAMKYAKGLL